MNIKPGIIVFFISILFLPKNLHALSPVVLTDVLKEYPLGLEVEILEDRQKELKLKDVLSPGHDKQFIPSSSEIPNFGYIDYAYWVRFKLLNKSSENEWYLEIKYPLLDLIEVYIPEPGKGGRGEAFFEKRTAGENYPFKHRELKHQNFVFRLTLPPGEEMTYYLRFESTGSMQIPLAVLTPEVFAAKNHEKRLVLGLYYGIILVMLLYNLFIFFSLRDVNYLFYVGYLANYGLVQLSLNGLAFEYIWPGYPWWSNKSMPFLISSLLIWLSSFASSFLIARTYAPRINVFLRLMIPVSVVGMGFSLIGDYYAALVISIGTVMLYIPLAMTAALLSWRKGYRSARYFFVAWFVFLWGSFIYILRSAGALPNNVFTNNSMQIGSAMEVVLLSLALADRINIMKQEKEEAQSLAIENLHKADELKDEFLANTSHELKTPLNGIIGITEAILEGAAGDITDSQKARLGMILSSGRRLLNLVNDILDFSKLKHHDISIIKKPVDMRQVTEFVMMLSRPLLSGKQVNLVNDIDENIPPVLGDETRLQQIMHNLIGNAIKFTNSGEVRVSAQRVHPDREGHNPHGFLLVTVSDTGAGIPEDKFDTIFNAFEQADASTSRLFGGTGLGLSITRQLVELHGGSIRVESETGKGSDFIIVLPAAGDSARVDNLTSLPFVPAIEDTDALEAVSSLMKEHHSVEPGTINILAVDDDPINLQVVADQLSLMGYSVTLFTSGSEALKAVMKEEYDLVLLDVMMPGMNGFEVCRKIRETFTANELPVIMLTARDQVIDLVEGLGAGASDYLTKPISKSELISRIKTHLDNTSLYRQLKRSNEDLDYLMKEFSRLTSKIHNSLKNKLESLRNILTHTFLSIDDREKLIENLAVVKKLVSHCSYESQNILFVIRNKECSMHVFLEELEMRAELTLAGELIQWEIRTEGLKKEYILKPAIVQNLLDIYTETLNNIVKHSTATTTFIDIILMDGRLVLRIKDNGLGFDYAVQSQKKGSYGLTILNDLALEINASILIDAVPDKGTAVEVAVDIESPATS